MILSLFIFYMLHALANIYLDPISYSILVSPRERRLWFTYLLYSKFAVCCVCDACDTECEKGPSLSADV